MTSKVNEIRNKVAHDLEYNLTEEDIKIFKQKCIDCWIELFEIQKKQFSTMREAEFVKRSLGFEY